MSIFALALALALDFILGDPPVWWHPVRLHGRAIVSLERLSRRLPFPARVQGVCFLAFNLLVVLLCVFFLLIAAGRGPLGLMVNACLIYSALGGTCLAREVAGVGAALARGGAEGGRERLKMLVSRDTEQMEASDIVSSAIETLAENFSDSAAATLFYAALGGPVLAWLHRSVNTLDAMVGYKTPAYLDFGWASARLDDLLNYPPARISALLTALAAPAAGGTLGVTLVCVRSGGASLSSPNSGYPIAAFAGALGVTLCGPTRYFGQLVEKPYIGFGARPGVTDLVRALSLYWSAYALAAVSSLCLAGLASL